MNKLARSVEENKANRKNGVSGVGNLEWKRMVLLDNSRLPQADTRGDKLPPPVLYK